MLDLNRLPLPRLFEELTADGSLDRLLAAARAEDLAEAGDVTTQSILAEEGRVVRVAGRLRETGTLAGLAAIPRVLDAFGGDARLEPLMADGDRCPAGQTLFRLHGDLAGVLAVERTLLNIVSHLSGIATLTRRYVESVAGTGAVICDTRKTTPGLRALEKYAVRCGGGTLHRLGLHDAVLLKDNHLAHLGPTQITAAVTAAAKTARARYDLRFVEVEVDTLEQLRMILECEAGLIDMVLLDNMSLEQMRKAVALCRQRAPGLQLEASGGIDLGTVRAVAETGVDRISVGALTHSAPSLDIALDVAPDDPHRT